MPDIWVGELCCGRDEAIGNWKEVKAFRPDVQREDGWSVCVYT